MFLVGMVALALLVLPPGLGIAAVALGIVVEVAEVGFWVRFLRRYRVTTGAEGLIGARAEVIEACAPSGRVRLRGEIWHARCPAGAGVGDRVRVTAVDGLILEVEAENGKGPR
ncbi:MAG TPA: NfeD family protein [Solirubrobacterales bacterium]|nr:NfeD family protein [Solirubrobacterales bacterium]